MALQPNDDGLNISGRIDEFNSFLSQDDYKSNLKDIVANETDEYKFRYPLDKENLELDNKDNIHTQKLYKAFNQYKNLIDCNNFNKFISKVIFGDKRPKHSSFKDQSGEFTVLRKYNITCIESNLNKHCTMLYAEKHEVGIWLCETAIDMATTALVKAGNRCPNWTDVKCIVARYNNMNITDIEIQNLFTYGIQIIRKRVVNLWLESCYNENLTDVYVNRTAQLMKQIHDGMTCYFYDAITDTFMEKQMKNVGTKMLDFAGIRAEAFSVCVRSQNTVYRIIVKMLDKIFNRFNDGRLEEKTFQTMLNAVYVKIEEWMKSSSNAVRNILGSIKELFDSIFKCTSKNTLVRLCNSWMNSAIKTTRTVYDTIKVYLGYIIYKIYMSDIGQSLMGVIRSLRDQHIKEKTALSNQEIFDMLDNDEDEEQEIEEVKAKCEQMQSKMNVLPKIVKKKNNKQEVIKYNNLIKDINDYIEDVEFESDKNTCDIMYNNICTNKMDEYIRSNNYSKIIEVFETVIDKLQVGTTSSEEDF
jgi:hypothetical protein